MTLAHDIAPESKIRGSESRIGTRVTTMEEAGGDGAREYGKNMIPTPQGQATPS